MKTLQIDNYVIDARIEDILRRLQLTSQAGKLKDIREKTSDIVVTCPNDEHSGGHEQNPDCHINIDDSNDVPYGYFHCFACGAKGDFADFVAHVFSSSKEYAKKWLIEKYGSPLVDQVSLDDPISLAKPKDAPKILDESILDEYQTWTPYLAKRGLSREMCENFKVRYDPKYRQVIFPVYDVKGRLRMLAKRNIDTKVFYLDEGQEKEVYGLNVVRKNGLRSCMITEGPIDMLTGWTHGVPTIATLGAISEYQIEQLNKSGLSLLYLAFDNDAAGRKFAATLKRRLSKRIMTVDVELPKNRKDVNDLTNEEWDSLIRKYFCD